MIKLYSPSASKDFKAVDEDLPEGFRVYENVRRGGKHCDKEFLTPCGEYVLRSKVAAQEYCKLLMTTCQPDKKLSALGDLKVFKDKIKQTLSQTN